MIDADSIRADLLDELATELGSIADRWNLFERVRGTSGPEYLADPTLPGSIPWGKRRTFGMDSPML